MRTKMDTVAAIVVNAARIVLALSTIVVAPFVVIAIIRVLSW